MSKFFSIISAMAKRSTLFLADDDSDDVFLFGEVLEEIDPAISFVSAINGQDALEKLAELGKVLPDIIFLDLNMPRMGGKECLVLLKKDKDLQHIPVIIYTTSSYSKDIEETLQNGAICFISKPASIRELKEVLSAICSNMHDDLNGTLQKLSNRETSMVVY